MQRSKQVVNHLRNHKFSGVDNRRVEALKVLIDEIFNPLTFLINNGELKMRDKPDLCNYRPINSITRC